MQESIVFLVRVQCRRKESSRSLSQLLMSFLYKLQLRLIKISKAFMVLLRVISKRCCSENLNEEPDNRLFWDALD